MLSVSDAYKELVKSNIRPKIEPEIKISGIDNTGKEIEIVWTGKNITELNYKRGIDPAGRELPFMELTWTELYFGKLNENVYPEKYNNVTKYMKVELSFYQDLDFFNTWKTLFNSGMKWADVFKGTWKQLKNEIKKEKIVFPVLFLTAKPTYKNQTITWKAVDLLSFLEEQQTGRFDGNISFVNVPRVILLNERGNFMANIDMFNAIRESDNNLKVFGERKGDILENEIIVDGMSKDLLMEYLNTHNYYLDFNSNSIKVVDFSEISNSDVYFKKEIMKEYPQIEISPNLSSYFFKSYSVEYDNESVYSKSPTEQYDIQGIPIYKTIYNGYGSGSGTEVVSTINYALSTQNAPIDIIPINWIELDNSYIDNVIGESYNEDNPCNTYTDKTFWGQARFEYLKKYFKNSSVLRFNSLSNLAIETGDIVFVETNLYDLSDNNIFKKGVVVEIGIKYNGAIQQSFIVHEIK